MLIFWRVIGGIVQDEFADARHVPKSHAFEFTSDAQKLSAHFALLVEIVERAFFDAEVPPHVLCPAEFGKYAVEIARLNWFRRCHIQCNKELGALSMTHFRKLNSYN